MAKEWAFPVALRWYLDICNSHKTVEGRVPDPSKPEKDYSLLVHGDILIFTAVNESFKRIDEFPKVEFFTAYNRKYESVRQMIENEGIRRVLPGVTTIQEGIAVYHAFPGYEERIKQHGIHAIGLGARIS